MKFETLYHNTECEINVKLDCLSDMVQINSAPLTVAMDLKSNYREKKLI